MPGLAPGAEAFTHCGVYAGDGMVWDHAPTAHVRLSTLASFTVGVRRLRAVRLRSAPVDATALMRQCRVIQRDARYAMARFATGETLQLLGARVIGVRIDGGVAAQLVCSTFVFRVLRYATDGALQIPHAFVLPADFLDPDLTVPVHLTWCRPPMEETRP